MNTTGFWWVLLAAGIYSLFHSLLAENFFKRMVERVWGTRAFRRFYRLFFSFAGAVTLLPLPVLAVVLPDAVIYTIPAPWLWLTLALQATSLVGLAVGVLQAGALSFVGIRQLLEHAEPREAAGRAGPEKLVVSGLYAYMRHPLYTFSLSFLWLTPVMTWNLLALIIAFSVYMLVGAYFFEEPKLIEQFGPDYEAYRRRTPMLIPGLKFKKPAD
jgi:methanethiol S-methyltransferase